MDPSRTRKFEVLTKCRIVGGLSIFEKSDAIPLCFRPQSEPCPIRPAAKVLTKSNIPKPFRFNRWLVPRLWQLRYLISSQRIWAALRKKGL